MLTKPSVFAGSLRRVPGALFRYAIPVVGLALATGMTVLIRRTAGSHPAISFAYLLVILASAWWGGYGPGVLSCCAAMFVVPYALTPHFNPAKVDPIRLVLVLLVSVLVSRVAAVRDKIEAALLKANESLDERVQQSTAELRRSNAELQRLNEDLNQFAHSASHDLQEPLRMMAIHSQLLERKYKGQLDAQADQYIQHIIQGAQRMDMLLRDLLVYTQAIHISPENVHPVDGNAIVAKALCNLSAAIDESGAKVTYGDLPALKMREVHLLQLFQNLIGNAIKYRSEEIPCIEIGAEENGSHCNIYVRDNGIGIPSEYKDQIFRVFKRLHNSEKYAGTGIGLAICQRIVERYGGQIWVDSEANKGSIFRFSVSVEKAH